MATKTFTQQRAILRPNKNAAFFAHDDDDDDDDDLYSMTDDDASSSMVSINSSNNADTLVLAQFLATTGPEEFLKPSKKQQQNPQFRRASRLFNRLRKKGSTPFLSLHNNSNISTISTIRSTATSEKQQKSTYIPLPVYQPPSSTSGINTHLPPTHQRSTQSPPQPSPTRSITSSTSRRQLSLRDSGIYSDVSEKEDMIVPPVPPPSLPAKSQHRPSPQRPAPLPPSVASAAIASATASIQQQSSTHPINRTVSSTSATSMTTEHRSVLRHSGSVPAAALKRRSVRVRHMQVQTDPPKEDEHVCSQCHQPKQEKRRTSCPSVLPTGQMKQKDHQQLQLLAMIEQLKQQLAQEQQSRLQLELAMTRQQTEQQVKDVAQEKDRWKGDCLWLNDRIALLPE
ncbi:uncharacterized protein BX664DRAFT_370796 [Halteromyces radiatus]|uniref:uncharacterized protein n=1 Tax=Halteromyces radiatus TaxID=101107 RepID=UPI00221FF6EC|nr:uncharacterized protein BX664DRAFT_370796 [Halteromyces radiatus]KAI8097227.1 hypothetical protein BX664DRAFT_370796 [Halteromyces radiatus]